MQHGARALSFQAVVTMVMSVFLPKIVQWTGYRAVYFTSQMVSFHRRTDEEEEE